MIAQAFVVSCGVVPILLRYQVSLIRPEQWVSAVGLVVQAIIQTLDLGRHQKMQQVAQPRGIASCAADAALAWQH